MSRYLDHYRKEGFFLRIKNLVLTDHYIGEGADLYLALRHVNGHDEDASFFERFDIRLDACVLKITNGAVESRLAILKAFERYLSELSPATILFNEANYLEIDDHNGSEYDEGWMSWFGNFEYSSFALYTGNNADGSHFRSPAPFHIAAAMLHALSEMKLPITTEYELLDAKFGRLIRLLNLCASEIIPETITFLNGYYLQRRDLELMRAMYSEDFEKALRAARAIVEQLGDAV